MSRWLQNVGSFLEKLDGEAERVVVDHHTGRSRRRVDDDDEIAAEIESVHLESILQSRGLQNNDDEEDEDDNEDDGGDQGHEITGEDAAGEVSELEDEVMLMAPQNELTSQMPAQPVIEDSAVSVDPNNDDHEGNQSPDEHERIETRQSNQDHHSPTISSDESYDKVSKSSAASTAAAAGNAPDVAATVREEAQTETAIELERESTPEMPPPQTPFTVSRPQEDGALPDTIYHDAYNKAPAADDENIPNDDEDSVPLSSSLHSRNSSRQVRSTTAATTATAAPAAASVDLQQQYQRLVQHHQLELKQAAAKAKEADKESKTLKRHVFQLHEQLQHAEAELQAQRDELERAAARMEADRQRQKQEREAAKTQHAAELKMREAQQQEALTAAQQRAETQLGTLQAHVRTLEQQRVQEGGNWDKEIEAVLQREQEMQQTMQALMDEKETYVSQIATLQHQQDALGHRLEHLQNSADVAQEREHEAEARLDEALTLHARQIAQRQAREAELERTLAELGAALVTAQKEVVGKSTGAATLPPPTDHSWQHDMETMSAQLDHERQRVQALETQLQEIARERVDEATWQVRRQAQHDEHMTELKATVTRLQKELDEATAKSARRAHRRSGDAVLDADDGNDGDGSGGGRIRDLSEEVVRQREKLANTSSEVAALKSRLQAALDRAAKAETALEHAEQVRSSDEWTDVELAGGAAAGIRTGGRNVLKQRGAGNVGVRRHRGFQRSSGPSMRTILRLETLEGTSGAKLGKALDGIDAFLAEAGKLLRFNPLARLLFILYLVVLHCWTFLLVMMHTHRFETVHGDFGAGNAVAHGPPALMQQQHVAPANNPVAPDHN